MSRKTRSRDVVCGFRDTKIENSVGEEGSLSKAARVIVDVVDYHDLLFSSVLRM